MSEAAARAVEPAGHVVGRADDVPVGAHVVVAVGKREFGIFNVAGRYHAILNTCLHQGGPVCRGRLGATLGAHAEGGWHLRWEQEGEVIACPWHRLEFNVTTGQCIAYPDRYLPTFDVAVRDGDLWLMV